VRSVHEQASLLLGERGHLSLKVAGSLCDQVFEHIRHSLQTTGRFAYPSFGVLTVRKPGKDRVFKYVVEASTDGKRRARILGKDAVEPEGTKTKRVTAKRRIGFAASKELKDAVGKTPTLSSLKKKKEKAELK